MAKKILFTRRASSNSVGDIAYCSKLQNVNGKETISTTFRFNLEGLMKLEAKQGDYVTVAFDDEVEKFYFKKVSQGTPGARRLGKTVGNRPNALITIRGLAELPVREAPVALEVHGFEDGELVMSLPSHQ
ncbi:MULTISPECIES: hypothetical protein [unclassified Pseudodesulfovibrio]|uniref:hypothetical protein n=1 Tax=unclassified Pseudodesulfovibrio TaxID=2661612 RepID=UPI000FEC1466|nr:MULTISPECIES: hypothetical protein [unclassified Pseudodesulfovibrio]MCJ2163545.1 hypothetical protein [Pseudodesulfovibrio sp. S3-i]RWU06781.1 hypothetical protein DWB63_03180 [Pseudodesulfovibrio sp. S3]